jgi:hypothetical protein
MWFALYALHTGKPCILHSNSYFKTLDLQFATLVYTPHSYEYA